MFFAPPIRVPTDADSEVMQLKQAEMQAALESVRDAAEAWFQLSDQRTKRSARHVETPRLISRQLKTVRLRAFIPRPASPARSSFCRRD